MIKLGWKADYQDGPLDLLDGTIAADEYGFDVMDAGYQQSSESAIGQVSLNWAWLGAAAAKTQRIHLGPGVPCSMLRGDTPMIAQAAQTLTVVAQGRSYVSVNFCECPGTSSSEEGWLDQNEQQDMMVEAIDLLRQFWGGQPVTYRGHYFTTRRARINTHCDQNVAIYLTLKVPGNAYFAGYYGDGMITTGGMKPQVYRRILAEFARGAREAGKDPAAMPRMVELPVTYQIVEEPQLDLVIQAWGSSFFAPRTRDEALIPVTAHGNGQSFVESEATPALCVSADKDCHAALAQEYIDMGFDTLLFKPVKSVPLEFIKGYGRDVLPRIRASNLNIL